MKQIDLTQFKQTNLRAVLERANELLASLAVLSRDQSAQESIVANLIDGLEPGDEWERAALYLIAVELFERRIRTEDTNVEKYPEDWNGGIYVGVKD